MIQERVKLQTLSDSALEATIDIKAPPEKVFGAWTQQEQFIKWFGPRSGRLEVSEFDCQVGGQFNVTMVFDDGDRVQLSGTFKQVDPPRELVFSWQWTGSDDLTEVTVLLAPSATGTTLTLTHSKFASVEDRDQHQSGWAPIVTRLATVLESEQ